MDKQTKRGRDVAAVEKFDRLVERWISEDPSYDQEVFSELKKSLDRDRPSYRKLFPEESES